MAGTGEKVARDFCLSTLQNNVRQVQDECRNEDADPNDLRVQL